MFCCLVCSTRPPSGNQVDGLPLDASMCGKPTFDHEMLWIPTSDRRAAWCPCGNGVVLEFCKSGVLIEMLCAELVVKEIQHPSPEYGSKNLLQRGIYTGMRRYGAKHSPLASGFSCPEGGNRVVTGISGRDMGFRIFHHQTFINENLPQWLPILQSA